MADFVAVLALCLLLVRMGSERNLPGYELVELSLSDPESIAVGSCSQDLVLVKRVPLKMGFQVGVTESLVMVPIAMTATA